MALAVVMLNGLTLTAQAAIDGFDRPLANFDDVGTTEWFYGYVSELTAKGYMNGVSMTSFAPHSTLTRGMLVTVLYRMEKEPDSDGEISFQDVETDVWYTDAVYWAANAGIVDGYSKTMFAPNEPITRQEMATILWRYARHLGMNVSTAGETIPAFADRDEIAPWAGQAISWAYTRGIIQGRGGNVLDPNGQATRAEAAAVIARFIKLPTGNEEIR